MVLLLLFGASVAFGAVVAADRLDGMLGRLIALILQD
jgi:hypothetical protein